MRESAERLMRGRTTLTIAHRLHTTQRADRIVVLEGGRVADSGTHEELLAKRGLYRRLVEAGESSGGSPDVERGGPADACLPPAGPFAPPPVALPRATCHASSAAKRSAIAQLLRLAAPCAARMLLAALLGVGTVGSNLGLIALSAHLLSTAALRPPIGTLALSIVGVRFFGIARGACRYAERLVGHEVTFRLLARLRVRAYKALEPLAPAILERRRSGDVLSRLVADVESLQHFFLRVLHPPAVAAAVAVLTALFVGAFVPTAAWLVLAGMGLAGVALPLLARRRLRATGRETAEARSALTVAVVDGLQGMTEILAFGRGRDHALAVDRLSGRLLALQRRAASITSLTAALGGLSANLASWSVLAVCVPLVSAGALDGVYLAMLCLAALVSFEAALSLPEAVRHLDSSTASAERLTGLSEEAPPIAPVDAPASLPKTFEITVRNLQFRYGPEEPWALNGVSLDLRPGNTVAIVGPSGAGKSTLVSLLLRFRGVGEGQIALGGRDLAVLEPEEVRRCFAVVPQRTHLFNASIRENLLLARPEATEDEIVAVATQAGIHDFIHSLPQGYDTMCGEQGLRLSGGERQRLALARALLKDAPILLLDEPTAHLDALTERRLGATFLAPTPGRAVLLITHRLVGLERVDEIVVLRKGAVAERGTHEELLARHGFFHRMWELQHSNMPG